MNKKVVSIMVLSMVSITALGGFIYLVAESTPPWVEIESPISTVYENTPILINLTATDQGQIDRVWFNWNGTDQRYVSPIYMIFPVGLHTFHAFVRDVIGGLCERIIQFTVLSGNNFSSIWDTSKTAFGSSASNQVKLPLYEVNIYQFRVSWGDGTSNIITSWDQAETLHTYATTGIYNVNITGTILGFKFGTWGYLSDNEKLLEINHWGDYSFGNLRCSFLGCSNLIITATDTIDMSSQVTLSSTFEGCSSLVTIPGIESWDTSNVEVMYSTFSGAVKFNGNIQTWDTSQVFDMSYMFCSAEAFNQDIGNWNVSNLRFTNHMFQSASAFNQDLSSWNVSKVEEMQYMFMASGFNQDIGSWDVSNVKYMDEMFSSVTLSVENYDSLLIGWSQLDLQSDVVFHAGSSKYSSGTAATARASIISEFGWTIYDGGQV